MGTHGNKRLRKAIRGHNANLYKPKVVNYIMRSEKRIKPFMKLLTEMWEESPDLRFGQFLINTGLVADDMVTWNSEMLDYGISHKYLRGIQTWGTYGKDGKSEYEDIYIKDLATEHIKSILKTQTHIFGTPLEKVLKEELKWRKKNGKT